MSYELENTIRNKCPYLCIGEFMECRRCKRKEDIFYRLFNYPMVCKFCMINRVRDVIKCHTDLKKNNFKIDHIFKVYDDAFDILIQYDFISYTGKIDYNTSYTHLYDDNRILYENKIKKEKENEENKKKILDKVCIPPIANIAKSYI